MKPQSNWPAVDAGAAATEWLSQALLVPSRGEWLRGDPVQVLTGVLFDAVQIPVGVIRSQVGSADRAAVEAFLGQAGIDSAVIAQPPYGWYYALVPPGTAQSWKAPCECFGISHSIAVPAPHRADPPGVHWLLTPPDGAASLCDPERVHGLASIARVGRGC